jgi:signal transduction histidine kinase
VSVVGKALDGLGRWYVAMPPFIIVLFLLALFFITGAGQERLREAGERLQQSAAREHNIDELQVAVSRAVASLRGYLLTEDDQYLARYETARGEIEPRLDSLRLSLADSGEDAAAVRNLQVLVGKRLADLGMIRTIRQRQDATAALALVKASVGTEAGLAISDRLDTLRQRESIEHVNAVQHWRSSLTLSRWIAIIGTIISMVLVTIAARLIYMDFKRRTLLTAELKDQNDRLEREVSERTQELVALSTHLQNLAEREKASLARELHDELGGLLVGARMDISWAEQHLSASDPDMQLRLSRVQQNLAAGVDLKRRIIEELRPTLLDNVGLTAALRWQLKETCRQAGLSCVESYPQEEPPISAEASIALFRIAQEAFLNIVKHSGARMVDVSLDFDSETLLLRIADDGKGIPIARFTAVDSHGLASMRHRVRALRGRLDVRTPRGGGTLLVVQVPMTPAVQTLPETPAVTEPDHIVKSRALRG